MTQNVSSHTPAQLAPLKRRIAAWGVHIFTMTGLAFAILATLSLIEHNITMMWLWLVVAMLVDGVDGSLARKVGVKEALPWFDGGILDIIIDYLTWTFIPAMFMYTNLDLGPKPLAGLLIVLVLTSSTLCYANEHWKSTDFYFYGFPAAWNIVAVILYVLQTGAAINIATTAIFVVLTIVPSYWTHPFRVARFRIVNIASVLVWSACVIVLVAVYPRQPLSVMVVFWVTGVWFLLTGALRTISSRHSRAR
ncbi:MAG: CDP-alcohol phosphatidyltransferase family protein [Actinomycetaceae bacterium]|nr:CDP-alcohol phosphatidyltransferase family protein [Arcanobacterium sp.]MDD7505607.1 CDP-alcohol phosphatidyltransferase family protein [Actinomycetaceae bacterium]MDY6143244.1 CDP-alcohol phosphatidyltransferase family protein [Arcanobacterium sp.]